MAERETESRLDPARNVLPALLAALLLMLLMASCACGGVVRTLDGRVVEGTVSFRDGQVQLQPRVGQPVRVAAADVLTVAISGGASETSGPDTLPVPWMGRDVGSVGLAGRATWQNGWFNVSGSGAAIGEKADAFHFVHQPAAGDFELIARVAGIQSGHENATAGLMIRENDHPGATCAMLTVRPKGEVSFHVRPRTGETMAAIGTRPGPVPVWLKLVRQKDRINGHVSADGKEWAKVGERAVTMKGQVLAGLAVSSHDNGVLCAGRIDHVELVRRGSSADAGTEAAFVRPGITLIDGNTWSGAIAAIADDKVRLTRDGRTVDVPLERIARVVFRPVPAEQLTQVPPGSTGVLLASGDFYDGEVAGIDGGRLRVSSILHGIRSFANDSLSAVLLRAADEPAGPVIIEAADGSVVGARQLDLHGDRLVVQDPLMGEVRWIARDLHGVMATAGRSQRLVDLAPERVEAPVDAAVDAWSTQASVIGGPLRLGGQTINDALSVAGGAVLRYRLDGRYRTLLCTAGIDAGVAPLVSGRLVIEVDGREAFTSPPVTSLDEPQVIAVKLEGASVMTLKVAPAGDAPAVAVPASVWTDALLVRTGGE